MAVQFQFVMRSGPTPGATYSLEGDQIVIGAIPPMGWPSTILRFPANMPA